MKRKKLYMVVEPSGDDALIHPVSKKEAKKIVNSYRILGEEGFSYKQL